MTIGNVLDALTASGKFLGCLFSKRYGLDLPSGSAGKFLEKIWNLENLGGATTTPLLSAECQNRQQSDLKLRAPRDTEVNKKSTKCQQNDGFFGNVSKKL